MIKKLQFARLRSRWDQNFFNKKKICRSKVTDRGCLAKIWNRYENKACNKMQWTGKNNKTASEKL